MAITLDGTIGITTSGTVSATGNILTSATISSTGGILTSATISSTGGLTLGTPLAATSGGTGVATPGTSGNILTSNGTAWTSTAPGTTVSSVNGQTGAVSTVTPNAIGSIQFAFYAISAPSGTSVVNYAVGTNVAGSNLRYSLQDNGGSQNWFTNWFMSVGRSVNGGAQSLAFTSLNGYTTGTALTGSWTCMSPFSISGSYQPAGKDPAYQSASWNLGVWARYA